MSAASPLPPNLIFLITITRTPERVRLSPLQQRILRLVVLGCEDAQIAAILGRNEGVVRSQKARALTRLGIREGRKFARWAAQQRRSYADDRLSPSERGALGSEGP